MTTTPGIRRVAPHDPVSDALISQVRDEGFGVLTGGLSPAEVAEINAEALRMCRGELGELAPAGDVPGSEADALRRYLCIHHPHKISGLLRRTLAHPAIVDVLTGVIGSNVK